jgi:hypothetical protein
MNRHERRSNFAVVVGESTEEVLVIRDLGPWDRFGTVTNDAERVVAELYEAGYLPPGRRLFYYDSGGDRDEIVHEGGVFRGFRPARRMGTGPTEASRDR